MKFSLTIIFVFGMTHVVISQSSRLQEVFSWQFLDFQFPNAEIRQTAIDTELFIPGNSVITGIEVYMDRLFVTVPRLKPGVPSTLNYIPLSEISDESKSPALIPYPSLDENLQIGQSSISSLLVSACRLRADACGRLWVIDTGLVQLSTESAKQQIPPTIHIFDLKTDHIMFSVPLTADNDYHEDLSFFPNIIVDVTSGNCDDAFVYLPDVGTSSLVVYSLKENETHRLEHNYFYFDPLAGDFYLQNKKHYQWHDGIFGMALSPIDKDNYRTAYFHPLASTMEFTISTRVLQNKTTSDGYLEAFRVLGDRGPNSQSSVSFLDEETGVVFYTQIVKNAVVCWNSYKGEDYSENTLGLVAACNVTMKFPNDIKTDKEGNIWILTDNFLEYMFSSFNMSEVNIRIYKAPIREAIKGTICD